MQGSFDERFKNLHEEFLQREINLPNLRADDFISYTKTNANRDRKP